jgi:putative colanic acid biosysnthesis UDP-glucose lipid carrier transferase
MPDTPTGTGRLSEDPLPFLPQWRRLPAGDLLCKDSVQDKAVRFGSLEPAHVTLAKQSILPLVVVLMLALCVLINGQPLSLQFYALGLVSFLITAQVFSPLEFRNRQGSKRTRQILSRIVVEWSCVVALLVFVAASFKLTHVFSRDILVSWFLLTPVALLLVDSLRAPLARWLASDRGIAQRYIIIGANEVGVELARRIETSHAGEKFFGFFDYRGIDRVAQVLGKPLKPNCSARDFADFVREHAISRVYLARNC